MDMSIYPGDSASQGSASNTFSSTGLDVSSFVLPGHVYLSVLDKYGVAVATDLLKFYKSQQNLVNRCITVGTASSRVNSSVGSVASSKGSGSRASGGLTGSRLSRLQGLESWRPKAVPSGFCYSKLLTRSAAESVSMRLGEWPTIGAVLREPAVNFSSFDELRRFRVVGDKDRVHVAAGGVDGFSFVETATELIGDKKYPSGSIGSVLAAYGIKSGIRPILRLSPRTLVGGNLHDFKVSALRVPFFQFEVSSCPSAFLCVDRDSLESFLGGGYTGVVRTVAEAEELSLQFGSVVVYSCRDSVVSADMVDRVQSLLLPGANWVYQTQHVTDPVLDRLVASGVSVSTSESFGGLKSDLVSEYSFLSGGVVDSRSDFEVPVLSKGMSKKLMSNADVVVVGSSGGMLGEEFTVPRSSLSYTGSSWRGFPVVLARGFEGVVTWSPTTRRFVLYDDDNFDYASDWCLM